MAIFSKTASDYLAKWIASKGVQCYASSAEVLAGRRMRLAEMEIPVALERLCDFKQRVTKYGEWCAEQKRGSGSEVKQSGSIRMKVNATSLLRFRCSAYFL
jgi:hypothetical protein